MLVRIFRTRTRLKLDRAIAHTAEQSLENVQAMFRRTLSSLHIGVDVNSPTLSPDMTSGFEVFENRLRTLEELKTAKRKDVVPSQPELLERMMRN